MSLKSKGEVSDDSDSYCIDESDTKTIDLNAPYELLDNPASRKPSHVDFDTGNESVTVYLQEKQKETVFSHKVQTPTVWNTLKEGEPF